MEFRIQKSEFLRGLRLAQGIADRKSTMPILANVLLRTDGKSKLAKGRENSEAKYRVWEVSSKMVLEFFAQEEPASTALFHTTNTSVVVGSGKMAEPGMNVSLNYRGFLLDGTPFDNSYDRGEPLKFQIAGGQMIQGFDEGVRGMRIGGKRKILVPWAMAYGEAGRPPIPPKADLVFDLELLDVK